MPASTKPMKRTELARHTPLTYRPFTQLRPPADPAWRAVRLRVLERSGGLCECCGAGLNPLAFECHHRKFRSQGGTDDPRNLLALLRGCHRRVHLGDRVAAEAAGLVVPSHADPAAVPLLLHGVDRLYLAGDGYAPVLDDEGGRCAAPDGGAA
jgi:hypothetical protein